MSRCRQFVCSIGLLICSAGFAAAQSDYRAEIFGGAGVSRYDRFSGSSGNTANFHAGAGLRPFSKDRGILRGLGLEFTVDTQSEKVYSSSFLGGAPVFLENRRRTIYLGNVLYHFTNRRVQPYGSIGLGASGYAGDRFAGAIGAGAKIFLHEHVSLRPEVRLSMDRGLDASVRGSIGIGYHW